MAEAKNNFLKAKMNQDLDDRLLPNGEYRTAQNVLVGKSEEDSVGTLQNIKGNIIIPKTQLGVGVYGQIEIIGYYMDPTNDRIITFTTDWNSSKPVRADVSCAIRSYNINNGAYSVLVEGSFLNFSQTNTIIAVNLLEDLLFWTDNRNQPRKINVETALREGASHYYKENHISVSKYNPYRAISLLKQEKETVISTTVGTNVVVVADNPGIIPGMTVLGNRGNTEIIFPDEYLTVTSVAPALTPGEISVTLSGIPSEPIFSGDNLCFLISTMSDQAENPSWPGDPDYLEDKFVRFGYRFKFEDNEYSVLSPFTQIAFVPKQKGYFINGDETAALSSTIVDFFENNINDVELIIPLPDKGVNIADSYKISSIDILYKESDALAVKVLDTINVSSINNDENFFVYSYQSRKPIKTLPTEQTVRVSDKTPVKAFSQEIVSNRVVYGNFLTKPTPPDAISYTVNFQPKIASCEYPSFIEYPNHNIKQNRNYQVGFVLSDKFGRQSSVILSPVEETTGNQFGGSTIYAEYIADDPIGSEIFDPSFMPSGVKNWFGNSLVMQINDPISGGSTGLYATPAGDGNGFVIDGSQNVTITDTTYTFTLVSGNIPEVEDCLRGKDLDYVKITNVDSSNAPVYSITTEAQVSDLYLPQQNLAVGIDDIKYSYYINPNGWYSYKIVVKQIEQDYYNVYLPSSFASSGLIEDSTDTDRTVSYLTLINDNINKIPRDLSEVGPDQKQYRSSVKLYGRVKPTVDKTNATAYTFGNAPFFPFRANDTSTAIGNADDLLGVTTDNKQFSGIVAVDSGSLQTVTIKNFTPSGSEIPRGAVVESTDILGVVPGTFVQNFTRLGPRYDLTGGGTPAPEEDGVFARVILTTAVSATEGNYMNFTTRPGAYIFQGDSNPIIARVSTDNQFGINYKDFEFETAADPEKRFQLAIYETDPFISAIDIYWESAEYGLISDVNEEVGVGYDGPTGVEDPGFSLFENDPINTNVTQTFYPLDQNGVQIPQTQLSSFQVEDGNGNITTDGVLFSITQITSGPDLGAYRIKTASEFTYLWDSENTNVYTFTIVVQNTNPATEWAFQTLSFQGSLENVVPDFTLPAVPNYSFIQPSPFPLQIIAALGNTTNPVNGTIQSSNEDEDLYWSFESGNEAGYFDIDPGGNITLSFNGATLGIPFDTYPMQVKLQDATEINDAGLVVDTNSLSVVKTIYLVAGFEQTNLPAPDTAVNSTSLDLGCTNPADQKKDFVIYLSQFNYNNLLSEFTFLPTTTYNITPIRMGPELQRGEFVFSCENWYMGAGCGPGGVATDANGFIKVAAYKRQTDSSGNVPSGAQWVAAPDLNGQIFNFNSTFIRLATDPTNASGSGYGGQNSYLAYGDPQFEYAFYLQVTRSSPNGALFGGDFHVRDLHYSGNNFEKISYEFNNQGQFPNPIYADSPLNEYNIRYFTDETLTFVEEVNQPPGSSGNSLNIRLSKRMSSVSSPGNVDLEDVQYSWVDPSGSINPTTPLTWNMRGQATFNVDNDVDKTGTPPYVTTQKFITVQGGWVTPTGFPGPYPFDRSYNSNQGGVDFFV